MASPRVPGTARRFSDLTWEEVRDADLESAVAILPVGAVEAHGPHLPLGTDVVIAEAMARACGAVLERAGRTAFLLPPLWYSAAPFADDFPGTVSVEAETLRATVEQIAESLGRQGIGTVAVANAHLDPAHVAALREVAAGSPARPAASGGPGAGPAASDGSGAGPAVSGGSGAGPARIVFLDLTRRRVAERLTEEFRTGACHAGRFEGSIVLAEAPELVRTEIAAGLPPNPASLSDAIRAGKRTFRAAGGERAYFGWPADASAEEGRATVATLGRLLAELVLEGEAT